MSSANIGWLFYKDYYRELNYIDLVNKEEEHNSKIIEKKVQNIIDAEPLLDEAEIIGSTRFQATTAYPGLILGSGNAHEIPDVKGQAILGFHFDYTSGLPVIAGSSIKGVLRSAFKHPEYIQALLDDENVDVKALEEEIFDNADIFYDAHIIKADAYGRILGDDYITPHSDPLKDPIPLRFIKVLPEVSFLFQFELSSEGSLSKNEKKSLFRKILEDLGLGAKTNVGYGKLTTGDAPKTEEEKALEAKEHEQRLEAERLKEEARIQEQREAKAREALAKKQRVEDERLAKEAEDKEKKEALVSQGLVQVLENVSKFKALETVVKKYIDIKPLDEVEKQVLEEHVKKKMKDKIKRKKFPFGTLGNDKCLGKERANTLADSLGLK